MTTKTTAARIGGLLLALGTLAAPARAFTLAGGSGEDFEAFSTAPGAAGPSDLEVFPGLAPGGFLARNAGEGFALSQAFAFMAGFWSFERNFLTETPRTPTADNDSAPFFLVAEVSSIIANGGFETGSFTSWSVLNGGNQAVVDSAAVCGGAAPCSGSPTEGSFEALLTTPGAANVSSLESFLGLTPGSLLARGVAGGSAISQTFTTDTAGILSFNWNLLTNETLRTPTANNDFASFFLTSEVPLGSAFGTLTPSGTQLFEAETGFDSVSISLLAGTYTLEFLVADIGDTAFRSGLLVDNVHFQPIPEPVTTFGGAALTLGLLSRIRRRKWGLRINRTEKYDKGA